MRKIFPSSGLSRVVWSKKPLTKEEVLAEETNIIPIADGTFFVYNYNRAK